MATIDSGLDHITTFDGDQLATTLFSVLSDIPDLPSGRTTFPLLEALIRFDHASSDDRARVLIFTASLIHRTADERRTAEYLLRHKDECRDVRATRRLISRARCAAEMDVRRVRSYEIPAGVVGTDAATISPAARTADPSLGEFILDFLQSATGLVLSAAGGEQVRDATAILVALARRHALNGGTGPSLIGMRPSARRGARLAIRLRDVMPGQTARALSRVLIGPDGTSLRTAAVWWAASASTSAEAVPVELRRRWTRDLMQLGQAVDETPSRAA